MYKLYTFSVWVGMELAWVLRSYTRGRVVGGTLSRKMGGMNIIGNGGESSRFGMVSSSR